MQELNTFTEQLLKNISESIKTRKENSTSKNSTKDKVKPKTRTEIAPGNEQLLSNVMNFHLKNTRNPYLLPIPKDTPTNLTNQIIKNLNYSSSYELVWDNGTINYFDNLEKLFYIGLNYLNQKHSGLISSVLLTDLHWTQIKAYNETHQSHIKGNTKLIKENAKHYLYETLWLEFGKSHQIYFKDLGTFKLDKNIENFFNTCFLNLLKQFNKINKPLSTFKLMCNIYQTINQQNTLLSKPLPEEIANSQELIKHGTKFINALIENQDLFSDFIPNEYKKIKNNAKYYNDK